MHDLISRQAAIDALDTGLCGVEWDKALATAMLEDLPSAQPERTQERTEAHAYCPNCGADGRYMEVGRTCRDLITK